MAISRVAISAVALPGLASLPAAHAAVAAVAAKPGLTGSPITLTTNAQFSGYDMATGRDGTAYIGWIGDTGAGRTVNLCALPRGATRCAGGIKTIASAGDSIGASGAAGLWVFVSKSSLVTLVWMHPTVASENGPEGDEIAIATSQGGGPLSGPADVSAGPSFGDLLDAALAPNGGIWTVTQHPAGTASKVQITRGLGTTPQTLGTPFWAGHAQIAFNGASAVLAIDKDGAISQPVYYARQSGSGWTRFKPIARTWNVAGFGMARTTSGVRLIATENNAGYQPVVSRLTGSGFSAATLTGEFSACFPFSHDVVADASGRLADASTECGHEVAVTDLANTRRAAVFRFSVHGTLAGGNPQLTTSPSGRGWVAWSIESASGDKLLVAPLLLPGLDITKSWSGKPGRVVVTGPASCLPPVDVPVSVAGKPASGWRVVSKSLKLGSAGVGTVLHGSGLIPGKAYTLTGTVTFAHGSAHGSGRASIGFLACPKP